MHGAIPSVAMVTVVQCCTYVCALLLLFFSSGNYVTHVVIVKDAVIGSPPHAILHGSLTNQIAITLQQSFLSLFDWMIQKVFTTYV